MSFVQLILIGIKALIYWVGPKICSSFSVTSFGKAQMNFWANPVCNASRVTLERFPQMSQISDGERVDRTEFPFFPPKGRMNSVMKCLRPRKLLSKISYMLLSTAHGWTSSLCLEDLRAKEESLTS